MKTEGEIIFNYLCFLSSINTSERTHSRMTIFSFCLLSFITCCHFKSQQLKQANYCISLQKLLPRPTMASAISRPVFLLAATLFTHLCFVVVNSQHSSTTWHAYNQTQVNELSKTSACARFWNSTKSPSNYGPTSALSDIRLWPGNVSLPRTFRCKHRIPSDLQTLDGSKHKLNNVILFWKVWCQQKKNRQ